MDNSEATWLNKAFESKDGSPRPARPGPFELRVALSGMAPEDYLHVMVSGEYAEVPVGELLAHIFPEADERRPEVASTFDLRANPDLPDIYAAFVGVFDEWRKGRCALCFSAIGVGEVDLAGLVSQHLEPVPTVDAGGAGCPLLDLKIEQRYRAVEYGVQQGGWGSKEELLEWLRSLTVLYYLDKHEADLPEAASTEADQLWLPTAMALQAKNLVFVPKETQTFAITEDGRRFIGRLLGETESYIDLYDHFKDTEIDLAMDAVRFDTGRGMDLRVQVFMAEGLDPIRTVFLLRMYDGTLDPFASSWRGLILPPKDEGFFDGILEPVVNRYDVDEALIGWVIESGHTYLEEREERARELGAQREVLRRMGTL